MGQKRYTPEQIIGKFRQAEVRSAEGARVAEMAGSWGSRSRRTTGGDGSTGA
jgi:hypothetical protein